MDKMIKIKLPYGKDKLDLVLDQSKVSGVLTSNLSNYVAAKDKYSIVKEAMENPICAGRRISNAKM